MILDIISQHRQLCPRHSHIYVVTEYFHYCPTINQIWLCVNTVTHLTLLRHLFFGNDGNNSAMGTAVAEKRST